MISCSYFFDDYGCLAFQLNRVDSYVSLNYTTAFINEGAIQSSRPGLCQSVRGYISEIHSGTEPKISEGLVPYIITDSQDCEL